jgi:signal transduction histidine kinase
MHSRGPVPGPEYRFIRAAARTVRRVRSPLLMLAAIALFEVVTRIAVVVPDPARYLMYVLVVAVAAATDGFRMGLICSVLSAAYSAAQPYSLGRSPDALELSVLVFTSVLISFVAGDLHDHLQRLTSALEMEKRQLEESVRTRTEFMNAAAHELRTPITVVTGYLSMLREGSFGPAPHRWAAVLEIVTRKAEELGNLVEQMLLSGSLEAGTIAVTPVSLDLRNAVREAAERANPRAILIGATINYQVPSRSVTVEADPEHVACILDNLINNALTYTERKPWVRITVMEDGDAQVLVEDRGIGVPPQMRDRIFDRFVRVQERTRAPAPGTGLGLAISRDLAEQQGGSLTLLRSEVGVGSLFVLRLPLLGSSAGEEVRAVAQSRRR